MSPTSDVAMLRTVMQPIAFSWGSGHPNQNGFRTIENGQKNMKYLPLGPTNYSDMLFQPVSTATWMMCYDVANPAGYPRYDWHQEVCKTRTLRLARSYPQEERNRHGDAWGPFRSVWCLDINFHLGKKQQKLLARHWTWSSTAVANSKPSIPAKAFPEWILSMGNMPLFVAWRPSPGPCHVIPKDCMFYCLLPKPRCHHWNSGPRENIWCMTHAAI